MFTFVTADEASMDAFLSVSAASAFNDRLRDYAASLVQQGSTRADWCLVGLEQFARRRTFERFLADPRG